eukprot:175814-Alexandrium_andersonii.AAC.1
MLHPGFRTGCPGQPGASCKATAPNSAQCLAGSSAAPHVAPLDRLSNELPRGVHSLFSACATRLD